VTGLRDDIKPPAPLAIYYGWPSVVNGAGGVELAVRAFALFSAVVFGGGLEDPAHPDHANTREIIARLVGSGVEVYGYLSLPRLSSLGGLAAAVGRWAALGVSGIFWDNASYDWGVTRRQQSLALDCTHESGLCAFVNAWFPDHVLGDCDEEGRPAPCPLRAGDIYLAESWLVGAAQGYRDLAQWADRADRLLVYRERLAVRLAAATTSYHEPGPFLMGWWGAVMYQLDLFCFTDPLYSAGGPADARLQVYSPPVELCGSHFVEPTVRHSDDGRFHSRRTDSGLIVVEGDGVSWGRGYCRNNFYKENPDNE
jgi:hypothetical protein